MNKGQRRVCQFDSYRNRI